MAYLRCFFFVFFFSFFCGGAFVRGQRKCSILEKMLCWTSLKTTVTPAGWVTLWSYSKHRGKGRVGVIWEFVLQKWIIVGAGSAGVKNTLLDFGKLLLMRCIDCGNVINTLAADIWCVLSEREKDISVSLKKQQPVEQIWGYDKWFTWIWHSSQSKLIMPSHCIPCKEMDKNMGYNDESKLSNGTAML